MRGAITLMIVSLAGVTPALASDPEASASVDASAGLYAEYLKTLTCKLTPGLFTVIANDPPQAAASITAVESKGMMTVYTLRFGSLENPKVVKYEYVNEHPVDGVVAVDALFAKALDWKDIATAHNVDDLTKSLGSYNNQDYYFKVTGDDLRDGIYLDPSGKTPSFSLLEIKQLHSIFGFLQFLDSYQGGSHVLESYLLQTRQDTDALFK